MLPSVLPAGQLTNAWYVDSKPFSILHTIPFIKDEMAYVVRRNSGRKATSQYCMPAIVPLYNKFMGILLLHTR